MSGERPQLRGRAAWRELERHHAQIGERHLRELFAEDPGRGERLVAEGAGLFLDYSKNRITEETIGLLARLAEECGWAEASSAIRRAANGRLSRSGDILPVSRQAHRFAPALPGPALPKG